MIFINSKYIKVHLSIMSILVLFNMTRNLYFTIYGCRHVAKTIKINKDFWMGIIDESKSQWLSSDQVIGEVFEKDFWTQPKLNWSVFDTEKENMFTFVGSHKITQEEFDIFYAITKPKEDLWHLRKCALIKKDGINCENSVCASSKTKLWCQLHYKRNEKNKS